MRCSIFAAAGRVSLLAVLALILPGLPTRAQDTMADMPGMPGMAAPPSPKKASAPTASATEAPQPEYKKSFGEVPTFSELQSHLDSLPAPVMDHGINSMFLFELFEYRLNNTGADTFVWDLVGWVGGDTNRLWIKSEGSQDLSGGGTGEADLQLLYGRNIAPFWDFQIGVRGKQNLGSGFSDNSRGYVVIGVQGLAPYLFDVEPSLYISDQGEVSGALTVSFDILLTQKLVLQPRFEGQFSIQGDPRFNTGSGVTETDIGIRLRYEIRREFAPYIGVSWLRSYGQTESLAREEGEAYSQIAFVAGLRLWW